MSYQESARRVVVEMRTEFVLDEGTPELVQALKERLRAQAAELDWPVPGFVTAEAWLFEERPVLRTLTSDPVVPHWPKRRL